MADDKPIIVVKKKGHHGGHHGGAWKVAYADFVTAMMCFFMVMWLLNSASAPTKKAIASYFRKPGIFTEGSGTPLQIGGAGIFDDTYAPPTRKREELEEKWELRKRLPTLEEELEDERREAKRAKGLAKEKPDVEIDPDGIHVPEDPNKRGESREKSGVVRPDPKDSSVTTPYMPEAPTKRPEELLADVRKVIEDQISRVPELQKLLGTLDVKIDADGLNIEIMDTDRTSMFARGSTRIQPEAFEAFRKLTKIISPLPNTLELVGHTDAKPFGKDAGAMTNWELSTGRANEARKLLVSSGLPPSRITAVVGKAAVDLRTPADPFAAANRRITLKMKFDLSKKIDLSKDPGAIAGAAAEANRPTVAGPPPATPSTLPSSPSLLPGAGPRPAATSGPPVHTFTAQEILKGMRKSSPLPAPASDVVRSGSLPPPGAPPSAVYGETPALTGDELFADAF